MPRKTNPEKDITISPVSAGAARSRRVAARPQHSATAAETPVTPAREPEPPARVEIVEAVVSERELSREEIARLAYSLWEARGCQGGSPDEDWLRAEQELRQRALATK